MRTARCTSTLTSCNCRRGELVVGSPMAGSDSCNLSGALTPTSLVVFASLWITNSQMLVFVAKFLVFRFRLSALIAAEGRAKPIRGHQSATFRLFDHFTLRPRFDSPISRIDVFCQTCHLICPAHCFSTAYHAIVRCKDARFDPAVCLFVAGSDRSPDQSAGSADSTCGPETGPA